ncbi:MAG: hypothetical protein OHK0038_06540 [Flammeovirgaceae bacterium]
MAFDSTAQTKDEKVYLWIAKKYNSDKVYVISNVITSNKELSLSDLKNKFKSAVVRKYGKDQNGDIEIDINGPKKDKELVERSREKQIEKMSDNGWQVFEFKSFNH